MSRTAPAWLREAFRRHALDWYLHGDPAPDHVLRICDGGPACWLAQFDELERPCSGRIEGVHLLSQQRIEKVLKHQLTTDLWAEGAIDPLDVPDLVELAVWDPRIGAPGCTGHHWRFDGKSTPSLIVPASALRDEAHEYIEEKGLDSEAERKFAAPASQAGAAAGLEQPSTEGVA